MVKCIITSNDIKVGRRKSCGYCPVAYCLKRVFRRNDVSVYQSYAFVGCFMIEFPPHIEKFIEEFDRKQLVRSISFELPEPPGDMEYRNDAA